MGASSPRVGNQAFALATSLRQWRVTHNRDIVPHLPEQFLGFHHTPTEVFYRNTSHRGVICDGSGEDAVNGANQFTGPFLSVYDHEHYYGVPIGEYGC